MNATSAAPRPRSMRLETLVRTSAQCPKAAMLVRSYTLSALREFFLVRGHSKAAADASARRTLDIALADARPMEENESVMGWLLGYARQEIGRTAAPIVLHIAA